jgi:hypothetical protein
MPAEDLAATLAAGLMRPADAEGSTRVCPHEPPAWWADYDLLCETVATLEAPCRLLSPRWPPAAVRRILEATGLTDVFAVNPTWKEAMNRARRQAVVTGRVAAAQCRSRISGPAH